MYLSMLNEKQKENFLELAYQMAFIDNSLDEKEKIMLESYCNEMQISVPEVICGGSIDEIIESMKKECTEVEKKIVLFEILGLALLDGNYDEGEKKLVEDISKEFGMEEGFLQEVEKTLMEYIELQDRMNMLVIE